MTEFEPELEGRRFFTGLFRNRREDEGLTFVKRDIHHPFVRKVYILLILMVLSLVPFMCIAAYSEQIQSLLQGDFSLLGFGTIMAIVWFIIMMCARNFRRRKPMDYLLLTLMFISVMLACINYAAIISHIMGYFFLSVLVTAALCLGLSFVAFSTNYDFTRFVYDLYIPFIIVFIVTNIAVMIIEELHEMKILTVIIGIVHLALFCSFFVVETQLMLGGRRRYIYYMDEHVLAVVHLFIDILFITDNILGLIAFPPLYLLEPHMMIHELVVKKMSR